MEMDRYVDHTPLKVDATYNKTETLCAEAKEYDSVGVYISSYWVSVCAELLKGTDVKVCTVVGFPLGVTSAKAKAFETAATIAGGAKEIDMVLNAGEMKAGYYDAVRADVKAVVEAAEGNCVKVVPENCLPTKEEIVKVCELCAEAGATFVKISTGFSASGTTLEDVKPMKDIVKGRCLVRAAGGVRCYGDMEKMVEAGADRIGASVDVKLVQKETGDGRY